MSARRSILHRLFRRQAQSRWVIVVPSIHVPVPDLCQNAWAKCLCQSAPGPTGFVGPERILAWIRPHQYSVVMMIVAIVEGPGPYEICIVVRNQSHITVEIRRHTNWVSGCSQGEDRLQ